MVLVCLSAVPRVTVSSNVTDVRRLDHGATAESVCRGLGNAVTVRWNTSELGPDVQFNVTCTEDLRACRLTVCGPLYSVRERAPVLVHCIAANDVGHEFHAWTFYASGEYSHISSVFLSILTISTFYHCSVPISLLLFFFLEIYNIISFLS